MAAPNLRFPTQLRNRVMMELMYRGGLRVGEVCQLQTKDLKRSEMVIRLRAPTTKSKITRWVPVEQSTLGWIEQWMPIRSRYTDGRHKLLFVTTRGTQVSPNYIWKAVQRYGRRAGIDGPCHPHMFRHTLATELSMEGVPMREVQALLGHKHIATTEIYTHVSQSELARRIRGRKR